MGLEIVELDTTDLGVKVRDELRFPRYTESMEISGSVLRQARDIGSRLKVAFNRLPGALEASDFRSELGIDERTYEREIVPFRNTKQPICCFGIDAILSPDGTLRVVEINTRPQFLGRYDLANTTILGQNDLNSNVTPYIKEVLDKQAQGGEVVIVSHPLNGFYSHHCLLAKQTGYPIAALQDLRVEGQSGNVILEGRKVDVIFRMFSMGTFLNPGVTDRKIVDAVTSGRLKMVNGPLMSYLAVKTCLPLLGKLGVDVDEYLPRMKVLTTGERVDLKEYAGWWLKTEVGGDIEFTLRLSRQNLQGWPGKVIQAMVDGELDEASGILSGRDNETAVRLKKFVSDMKKVGPNRWLLQGHIDSIPIAVNVGDGGKMLKTVLRIYYVGSEERGGSSHVFLEMLAGVNDRVSGAGWTVPLHIKPLS